MFIRESDDCVTTTPQLHGTSEDISTIKQICYHHGGVCVNKFSNIFLWKLHVISKCIDE